MTSPVTFKSIPGNTYNLLLLVFTFINFAFFCSFLYYLRTCNFRAKATLSGAPSPPIAEEDNLDNTPEKHAEPTDKEQTTDQMNVSPSPAEKSTDHEVVITGARFKRRSLPSILQPSLLPLKRSPSRLIKAKLSLCHTMAI